MKLRKDYIVIVLTLVFILALFGLAHLRKDSGKKVIVRVDGKVVEEIALDQNARYEIKDADGQIMNTVAVEDGKAFMAQADCPDHLCIGMGEIHSDGETVVCLPNRVVIEIKGGETPKVDMTAK